MEANEAFRLLKDYCLKYLDGKESASGWICIRGDRFCSRCAEHRRSALYILIDPGNPVYLNCFRAGCDTRRRVRLQDLKDLGFNNQEAIACIMNETGKGSSRVINTDSTELISRAQTLTYLQRDYLRKRLAMDITDKDAKFYRIIPDLRQMIIDNFSENSDIYKKLPPGNAQNWISFSTQDCNTFTIRSITGRLKLMISNKDLRFPGYVLQKGKKIETIVITEGIFDLINIYTKFAPLDNAIFIATLGFNNLVNLVKYYAGKYTTTIKNLVIFADSDLKTSFGYTYKDRAYRTVWRELACVPFESIWLLYNKKSKDFGDMSLPIKIEKVQIK